MAGYRVTKQEALTGALEWLSELVEASRRPDSSVKIPGAVAVDLSADMAIYREAARRGKRG